MENQVQGNGSNGGGPDGDWARERTEMAFDVFKVAAVPEYEDLPGNFPVKVTAHR